VTELPAPPAATQDPVLVAEGGKTYARYCGGCHGDGVHSGGIIPDLRYSRALSDDQLWHAVVSEGALKANGMVGWGKALGAKRIAEVRAFVIAKAQSSAAAAKAGTP
jgi:alcohol dehydrogenase (cytochrome c)/quinohemoprotein ethanol dehydrogenase